MFYTLTEVLFWHRLTRVVPLKGLQNGGGVVTH